MSRLYDRLMRVLPDHADQRAWLESAYVVAADNVSDYFFQHLDTAKPWADMDFPTLAPPLPDMFIEFRSPSMVRRADGHLHSVSKGLPQAWGILAHATDRAGMAGDLSSPDEVARRTNSMLRDRTPRREELLARLTPAEQRQYGLDPGSLRDRFTELEWGELQEVAWLERMASMSPEKQREHLQAKFARAPRVGWLIKYHLFIQTDERVAPHTEPLWKVALVVDGDGRILRERSGELAMRTYPTGGFWASYFESHPATPEMADGLTGQFTMLFLPAFLALSFMHCKNVVTRVERPPDWQQKAAVKKHKRPLVTYHVLEIEPMKQVLRTEGKSEEVGLKRALHICRGHFATYDEKPLFGRVKGTFWREAHVRGSLKEGLALKDYDVKAPKTASSVSG